MPRGKKKVAAAPVAQTKPEAPEKIDLGTEVRKVVSPEAKLKLATLEVTPAEPVKVPAMKPYDQPSVKIQKLGCTGVRSGAVIIREDRH